MGGQKSKVEVYFHFDFGLSPSLWDLEVEVDFQFDFQKLYQGAK